MDEPKQLQIHARIPSRYKVLDRSEQLPFSIVFGLCRDSSADIDPRPLVLDTTRSALDVPYALAHKLLTLHEYVSRDKQDVEVDLSRLTKIGGDNATHVVLPSPVGRKENEFKAFTTYMYHVDTSSELASILEPSKKYTIRLATEDLSVKWHAYGGRDQLVSEEGKPLQPSREERLVKTKSKFSGGHARFTAVSSLPWPPKVLNRMRPCNLQTQQSATLLEFVHQ